MPILFLGRSWSSMQGGVVPASLALTACAADMPVDEMWRAAWPRLHHYASCRCVDPSDAQDLVQEAALRALQQQRAFGSVSDLVVWGRVVIHNLSIDAYRRSIANPVALLRSVTQELEADP